MWNVPEGIPIFLRPFAGFSEADWGFVGVAFLSLSLAWQGPVSGAVDDGAAAVTARIVRLSR
jgi:hypothetical protein